MKEYKGIFFPDGETHLIEWIDTVAARPDAAKFTPMRDGKATYQYHKYAAALEFCKRRRVAVDIGAHVGLWSRVMALDFAEVRAFEPMPEHADCWRQNMKGDNHAHLRQLALGDHAGEACVKTRTPGSSGDTGVDPSAERSSLRASVSPEGEQVEMIRLDSLEIPVIDFIKIDCEGYEVFILKGARETLLRTRPCVIVEQKQETGMENRYGVGPRDAVDYLQSLGAKLRKGIQGDYILSWD